MKKEKCFEMLTWRWEERFLQSWAQTLWLFSENGEHLGEALGSDGVPHVRAESWDRSEGEVQGAAAGRRRQAANRSRRATRRPAVRAGAQVCCSSKQRCFCAGELHTASSGFPCLWETSCFLLVSPQFMEEQKVLFDELKQQDAQTESLLREEKSKTCTLLQALEGAPLKTELSLLKDNQELLLQLQEAQENVKVSLG